MRESKDLKQELNIEAMSNLLDHFRSLFMVLRKLSWAKTALSIFSILYLTVTMD